jgi:hypothetical protein
MRRRLVDYLGLRENEESEGEKVKGGNNERVRGQGREGEEGKGMERRGRKGERGCRRKTADQTSLSLLHTQVGRVDSQKCIMKHTIRLQTSGIV